MRDLKEIERWLKRSLKGKVSITKSVMITFLITGIFISKPTKAAYWTTDPSSGAVGPSPSTRNIFRPYSSTTPSEYKNNRLAIIGPILDGYEINKSARNAVIIGTDVKIRRNNTAIAAEGGNYSDNAVIIGSNSEGSRDSISIGRNSIANERSVSLVVTSLNQSRNFTSDIYSVAIGKEVRTAPFSVVLGYSALGYEASTLLGYRARGVNFYYDYDESKSDPKNSPLIKKSGFGKVQQTAIGTFAVAAIQSTAVGSNAYALGESSVSIGADTLDSEIIKKGRNRITDYDYNKYYKVVYDRSVQVENDNYRDKKTNRSARITPDTKFIQGKFDSDTKVESGKYSDNQNRIKSPTLAANSGSVAIGARAFSFGNGAISIGTLAFALGDGSTAVGIQTRAEGEGSIAAGKQTNVYANNSIGIGNFVEVLNQGGLAYGYQAYSGGLGSIAIGRAAFANVSLGSTNKFTLNDSNLNDLEKEKYKAYKLGNQSTDNSAKLDTYIGLEVTKDGDNFKGLTEINNNLNTLYKDSENPLDRGIFSLRKREKLEANEKFGVEKSEANIFRDIENVSQNNLKNNGLVIGNNSIASGDNSIALGRGSFALKDNSFSLGSFSVSSGNNAIAIGTATRALGNNSLVLGTGSKASHENSVAIGTLTKVSGKNNIALGNTSRIGVGIRSRAASTPILEEALAIGNNSVVTSISEPDHNGYKAIALGTGAQATFDNSVALGIDSRTDYSTDKLHKPGWSPLDGFTFSSKNNIGVISVGSRGQERRISNLASGSLDTDAVNVSQLKLLENKFRFTGKDDEQPGLHYLSVNKTIEDAKLDENIALKEKEYNEYVRLKSQSLFAKLRNKNGETIDYSKITASLNEIKSKLKEKGIDVDNAASNTSNNLTALNDLNKLGEDIEKLTSEEAATLGTFSTITRKIEDNKLKAEEEGKNLITEAQRKQLEDNNYTGKQALAENSIALGYKAKVEETATNGIAIGALTNVSKENTAALGHNIKANIDNSVFLGKDSKVYDLAPTVSGGVDERIHLSIKENYDKAIVKETLMDKNKTEYESTLEYGNFAGATAKGAVTIGEENRERRLQNVASGLISETSTDGINGSQLHATNNILSNLANSLKEALPEGTTLETSGKEAGKIILGKVIPQNVGPAVELIAGKNVKVNKKEENGVITYKVDAFKTELKSENPEHLTVTTKQDEKTGINTVTVSLNEKLGEKLDQLPTEEKVNNLVEKLESLNTKDGLVIGDSQTTIANTVLNKVTIGIKDQGIKYDNLNKDLKDKIDKTTVVALKEGEKVLKLDTKSNDTDTSKNTTYTLFLGLDEFKKESGINKNTEDLKKKITFAGDGEDDKVDVGIEQTLNLKGGLQSTAPTAKDNIHVSSSNGGLKIDLVNELKDITQVIFDGGNTVLASNGKNLEINIGKNSNDVIVKTDENVPNAIKNQTLAYKANGKNSINDKTTTLNLGLNFTSNPKDKLQKLDISTPTGPADGKGKVVVNLSKDIKDKLDEIKKFNDKYESITSLKFTGNKTEDAESISRSFGSTLAVKGEESSENKLKDIVSAPDNIFVANENDNLVIKLTKELKNINGLEFVGKDKDGKEVKRKISLDKNGNVIIGEDENPNVKTVATTEDLKIKYTADNLEQKDPKSGEVELLNGLNFKSNDLDISLDGNDNGKIKFDLSEKAKQEHTQVVSYTKEDGTIIVKDGDKFYEAKDDGSPDKQKSIADNEKIIVSLLDKEGKTNEQLVLNNVASALEIDPNKLVGDEKIVKGYIEDKAKELLEKPEKDLNKATNLEDLQVVAKAGLNFKGNDDVSINIPLGKELKISGEGTEKDKATANDFGAKDNIVVEKDKDGLLIKLASHLNNIESINLVSEDGKQDKTIKILDNGDLVLSDKSKENDNNYKPDKIITLDNYKSDVKLSYRANSNEDTKHEVLVKDGLNFTSDNGDLTITTVDETGEVKFVLNNKPVKKEPVNEGIVVYTKEDGTKIVKDSDGKYYEANDDNTPNKNKEVNPLTTNIIASVLNPEVGKTEATNKNTTNPIALTNIKGVLDNDTSKIVTKATEDASPIVNEDELNKLKGEISNLVEGKVDKESDQAANLNDIRGLAIAGLDFAGNDGKSLHRNLGQTTRILGEAVDKKDDKYGIDINNAGKDVLTAIGNIQVLKENVSLDGDKVEEALVVKLNKDLKNLESIEFNKENPDGTKVANGEIKGLKDLDPNATGDTLANKKYVDDSKTVAYTKQPLVDKNGKKYIESELKDAVEIDGKYYRPDQVTKQENGEYAVKAGMEDKDIKPVEENDKRVLAASVLNTDGKSDKPITLTNVASALGIKPENVEKQALTPEIAKMLVAKGKSLLEAKDKVLNNVTTLADLQALAQAGLDFKGNDGEIIHRPVGTELGIKGESDPNRKNFESAEGNIFVVNEKDGVTGQDELVIKLAKDLKNLEEIVLNNGKDGADKKEVTLGVGEIGKDKKQTALTANGANVITDKNYKDNLVVNYKASGDEDPSKSKETTLGNGFDFKSDSIKIEAKENGEISFTLSDEVLGKVDGRDNKPGDTETDGKKSAGSFGPTSKDNLNGKTNTEKVNAIRNGEAGIVVYTDGKGNRVYKTNDGNYVTNITPEGNKADGAEDVNKESVIASVVSPTDGDTKTPIVLGNVASALGIKPENEGEKLKAIDKEAAKKLIAGEDGKSGLLTTPEDKLNKATTLADLQALAQAGLDFAGDDDDNKDKVVHSPLGSTLNIKGGSKAEDKDLVSGNIKVSKDTKENANGLLIQLTKEVKGLNSIDFAKDKDNKPAGEIKGIAEITKDTDGHSIVNKKYVDDTVKAIDENVDNVLNGEAGIVVYTDNKGEKLVKVDDKYYKESDIKDGKPIEGKENVTDIIATVVNPNGKTNGKGNETTLSNIKGVFAKSTKDDSNSNIQDEVKNLVAGDPKDTNDTKKNNAANLNDIRGLAKAGLEFVGNDEKDLHKNLGEKLELVGEGVDKGATDKFESASGNIAVVNATVKNSKDEEQNALQIKLSKELKNLDKIDFNKPKDKNNPDGEKEANGTIVGLKDLKPDASGDTLVNKNYVDNAQVVIYTNKSGEKVVKASDGKFYKPTELDESGKPKPNATKIEPTDVIASIKDKPTILSNLADGKIIGSDDPKVKPSTQAITGNQLKDVVDKLGLVVNKDNNKIFDKPVFTELKPVKEGEKVEAPETFKDAIEKNIAKINSGFTFGDGSDVKDPKPQQLGSTLNIVGEGNITTKYTNDGGNGTIEVGLSDKPVFKEVVIENTGKPTITVGSNGIKISPSQGAEDSVELTASGLNNGGNKITNVAPGEISETSTDAINGSQLNQLVNDIETEINGGISTAVAMANLPQISGRGHTVAGAYGTYKRNHAIAVGLSGTDKTGVLSYKASGALTFKGDLSLGIGFGYQFGGHYSLLKSERIKAIDIELKRIEHVVEQDKKEIDNRLSKLEERFNQYTQKVGVRK